MGLLPTWSSVIGGRICKMGNYPSLGSRGGTVIGSLELNLCASCSPKCDPWYNCNDKCCACCPGITSPKGEEWEAAAADFKPFLDECVKIVLEDKETQSCNGCCANIFKAKEVLDADWTGRANLYLAKHNLAVEVCAFYTGSNNGAYPHFLLQFSKTTSATYPNPHNETTPLVEKVKTDKK